MKVFCVLFAMFAVLLLSAPLASAQGGWSGCPWGFDYNPMSYGYVEACINGPAPAAPAALKPAGLAKPAPAAIPEQGLSCLWWGDAYDPAAMLSHGPECLSQPIMAAKVAGLAKPEPAVIPTQSLPCLPWGDAYDPISMLSHGPECLSQPTDNAITAKSAGLAKLTPLTPLEEFIACGLGGRLDVLSLTCQQ
jgi:hypothetical protein